MTALIGRTYDRTVRRRFTLKDLANRAVPHMSQNRGFTRLQRLLGGRALQIVDHKTVRGGNNCGRTTVVCGKLGVYIIKLLVWRRSTTQLK
ncbi:hypothetical protein [Roseibium aggregatum]|uniref:hypothetical protein n=1 Tax=Roseibium aggregatum TaxID=187304 RepID=UPI001E633E76|nr:hypothetical protein [Roseibium aggregatum]